MKNTNKTSILVFALFAIFVLQGSIYTVHETARALILRLGKIVTDSEGQAVVMQPGIHFKIPLVDKVETFDKRIRTLNVQSSRIVTEEKKDVIVDSYVKWRVVDFPNFFTRTSGNIGKADILLRQKIVDGLRAEFGKRNIKEVVSGERLEIMDDIRSGALEGALNLGIEIVDVRIKRIDLPTEVSDAVYNRMRTERERIAAEHRAGGKEKAEALRAQADANVTITVAEAEATALNMRGEGDAVAAKIYADAYSQDEEFYSFYRSLEAYKQALTKDNDILVINPDSDFFKYLYDSKGAGKKG